MSFTAVDIIISKEEEIFGPKILMMETTVSFLAALSSSRSVVVCLSVGWSVGWSGDLCGGVCEKVTYRVSNGN